MNELRETQRWLASVILGPDVLEDVVRARTAGVTEMLRVRDLETAIDRLRAYANGYPARIHESLGDVYPAVKHLAGARRFAELTERYLRHVPVRCYNLNDVGRNLAEALTSDPLVQELPFLVDLARLEWAVWGAFHAPAPRPFDAAPLVAWDADQWALARLEFQPGVALVNSEWPIADLWQARDTPPEEIDLALEGRGDAVVVFRREAHVVCESIDPPQARALAALMEGRTLGEVSAELVEEGRDAGETTAWFSGWVGRSLIAGCARPHD